MKHGEVVAFPLAPVVRQSRPAPRANWLSALAGLTLAAIFAVVPRIAQAQEGTVSGTVLVEGAQISGFAGAPLAQTFRWCAEFISQAVSSSCASRWKLRLKPG